MTRLLLSLVLLVAWAVPSHSNIPWRAEYDAALDEAKRRNVPILVVMEKDGATSSAARGLSRLLQKMVVTLPAHQEMTHGTHKLKVRDRETGRIVERDMCALYRTVQCDEHSKIYLRLWQMGGEFSKTSTVPACFLLDSDGEILASPKNIDAQESGSLKAAIDRAQKKLGKGLDTRTYTAVQQTVDRAMASAQKGLAKKGIASIRTWIQRFEKLKLKSMVVGLRSDLEEIDMQGHLLLDQASQESNLTRKKQLLLRVKTQFEGLDSSKQADKALQGLR